MQCINLNNWCLSTEYFAHIFNIYTIYRPIKYPSCTHFYIQWICLLVQLPSVLWCCSLGGRKGIRPVKTEWWGTGVVIYLEWGANDLYMVQLMPLPPPSSFAPVKSRMVYLSGAGLPRLLEKRPLNGCICLLVQLNATEWQMVGWLEFNIPFQHKYSTVQWVGFNVPLNTLQLYQRQK